MGRGFRNHIHIDAFIFVSLWGTAESGEEWRRTTSAAVLEKITAEIAAANKVIFWYDLTN